MKQIFNQLNGVRMWSKQIKKGALIMPKRGEHIHKRKDGRWEARYKIGYDDCGKTKYRSIYARSYGEVKQKLEQAVKSDGFYVPNQSTASFYEAARLWQSANKMRHKGSTELKYDNLLNTHILPKLGSYRLSMINSNVLCDFMNEKLYSGRADRKGGLSPSYVRSIMQVVANILDFAQQEGMCMPMRKKMYKPPVLKSDTKILDVFAEQRLEKYIKLNMDETALGVLLSLKTGLRISEVCALKWSDIDLINHELHIKSTVSRVKSDKDISKTKLIIDVPKTRSSTRDIPICNELFDPLIYMYNRRHSEYVVSDNSDFVSPRTFEYRYHKLLKNYGVESINYHALRHTFATRCIEVGMDAKTLSEILGHSNVSITLNTYVHSSMKRKREQLEKLSFVSA